MKLGWKLILLGFAVAMVGMLLTSGTGEITDAAVVPFGIGAVLFWVGVFCLWFKIGGKPKRGEGSGKL